MTWQPIETFVKPEPKDEHSVLSERIMLYFPDMQPHEAIGQCRVERVYESGIYFDWVDQWNSEPFETGAGRVEPTHWMPLPEPPTAAESPAIRESGT